MAGAVRATTDAVLAVLADVAAGFSAVTDTVGDGAAPDPHNGTYLVLHTLPSGPLDGSMAAPDVDAVLLYQVSAWATTREQSQALSDAARTALLSTPLVVPGHVVMRLTVDSLGGTFRDADLGESPAAFQTPDRYRVYTTPA